MKRLAQKLQDRRGASMLMALLLFLVAAIVSAVIIAAAVSARSRVASDRAQQQTYLTVSSAAELLRGSIEGGKIADAVVLDENLRVRHVILRGELLG